MTTTPNMTRNDLLDYINCRVQFGDGTGTAPSAYIRRYNITADELNARRMSPERKRIYRPMPELTILPVLA